VLEARQTELATQEQELRDAHGRAADEVAKGRRLEASACMAAACSF